MYNLNDLQRGAVYADTHSDFIEEFDLNVEYVKLSDVEDLISNIDSDVSQSLEWLSTVIRRCK